MGYLDRSSGILEIDPGRQVWVKGSWLDLQGKSLVQEISLIVYCKCYISHKVGVCCQNAIMNLNSLPVNLTPLATV